MGDLISAPVAPRTRLRELLADPEPLVVPGAYDALSARLVEQAGFEAVYLTGFGASASRIGRPDVGLLSATDMVDQVRRLVDAVDRPVVADADTGYGNAINVVHTVRAYEQAGVAGLHLEDQVMPKRCGHMSGKAVIGRDEMVGKIRAAAAARRDPELVLIARTDAAAVHGLDDAIDRARAYADAGADVLFVEAPTSESDLARVAEELRDVAPLVFNWAEGGRTPPLPFERVRQLGFSVVLYPIATLLAATAAVQGVLRTIAREGSPLSVMDTLPTFGEFTDLIGTARGAGLEQRFRGRAPRRPSSVDRSGPRPPWPLLSGPRVEDQVERRLGGPAQAGEAGVGHHLALGRLVRLCPERVAAGLRQRVGDAQERGEVDVEPPHRVEGVRDGVSGGGLHDHPGAVGGQAAADPPRGTHGVAPSCRQSKVVTRSRSQGWIDWAPGPRR